MDAKDNIGRTPNGSPSPILPTRRYDVDWLRVIALLLLILYHGVISFQPWAAKAIYFIENGESLAWLWIPMEMINPWRIPLLFFISGMGLRFAMERRSTLRLLADRSRRILLPAVAGFFLFCPLNLLLFQNYHDLDPQWIPNPGHLWFLFNIFAYVLLLLPVVALCKKFPGNRFIRLCCILAGKPYVLLCLLLVPYALEGQLLQPKYFSLFLFTLHGFVIGMLCFSTGFLMASTGNTFFNSARSLRFTTLALAFGLYAVRLFAFRLENTSNLLNGAECILWILAALGFAAAHLNQDSPALKRLCPAVYPVYILHLPVQLALASVLFPLNAPALLKLILLASGTFATSWALYEIIRRIPFLRPLFGMKSQSKSISQS